MRSSILRRVILVSSAFYAPAVYGNPTGYDYCGSPCHGSFVQNNGFVVANVSQNGVPVYSYVGGQTYQLVMNSGGAPLNDVRRYKLYLLGAAGVVLLQWEAIRLLLVRD